MKKNKIEQYELERLSSVLRTVDKPVLSDERKLFLKNRIMDETNIPVSSYVSDVSKGFVLDLYLRTRIKVRVLDLIENRRQKLSYFSNVFHFHKKFVSAFVLFLMFFGMFSFLRFDTGVVMADTFTELISCTGNVYVHRDGEVVNGYDGMKIYERDKVITGVDGSVSIRFFDDSVSRLASDTEVVVNKLFRPSESSVKSYVEVSLIDGVVWSKVVNLVESQSSFVVEALDVYAMAKRAAFNVEVNDDAVEIDVFNYSVDVRTSESSDVLVGGQKVLFGVENRQVEIKQMSENEMNVAWVADNLVGDEEYLIAVEQKLLAAKVESLGGYAGEDYNFDGSFRDDVLLFLTFDDIKKKKVELDLAEKNFIAAEIKLNDGNLSEDQLVEVNNAISAFSKSVDEFYDVVEEVGHTDVEYSNELKRYVEDKILTQKKSLSLVEQDSPSYEIKLAVDDMAVFDDVEVALEEEKNPVAEMNDVEVAELDIVVPEEEVAVEDVVPEDFGVTVEGDKPLSPLLNLRENIY